jgi:hypothetical protein
VSPSRSRPRLRPSRRTLVAAALGGLAHAAAVAGCWSWFGFTPPRLLGVAPLAYGAAGAVCLGAVPAALLARGVVSPALVVAGAFLAAAGATWATYVAPPVSPTPVGPTPFGWYVLGWPVLLGVALVAGGVERRVRSRDARPDAHAND